jgi:peptide/nickel transport system substrate-binding protein
MIFKKKNLVMLLIMLILIATAGCSSNTQTKSKSQVLTIGMDKSTDTLDILKAADPLVWFPGHQITEALVYPGPDMKPQPLLAESWKRIDDVTWQFNLRKEVTFHDGTPFNAQAAKFSLERQQEQGPAWTKPPIKTITVEDDYTIRITTKEPFSPLLDWLMNPVASMVSPTAVEKFKEDYEKRPCGTGPFKVETFVPEQKVVLVRNEAYWGEKPKLEKTIYKIITDSSTRVMALQSGEVDVIRDLQAPEIVKLVKTQGFKVLQVPGVRTHYFGFNVNKDVFKDVKVRKAFNYAVDRKAIIENVMLGYGETVKGIVAPSIPGHLASDWYPYNPQMAVQLLEEAGWKKNARGIMEKNGSLFQVDIILQPWSAFWKPVAEVIQGQLREIGINANVRVMERGAFNEARNAGNYDLFASTTPAVHGGADYQLMSRFHSKLFSASTHASPGYVNSEIEQKLEQARAEIDNEKREALYQEVQKIIYEDAALILYVYDVEVVAAKDSVKGFKPHSSVWAIDLKNVYIE